MVLLVTVVHHMCYSNPADGKIDIESSPAAGKAVKESPAEGAAPPGVLNSVKQSRFWKAITHGVDYDIHKVVETDARVAEIHANAETFDHKAELSFKYLQVCWCCSY